MDINNFHKLDIVLLCGVYGAGKTEVGVKYFKDKKRLRVSRSEIRKLIYEMIHYGEPWEPEHFDESHDSLVKHIERKILEYHLHNNDRVLIINTFVTKKSRKRFVDLARSSNKTIGAIFVNRPLDQCIEKNKKSGAPVRENVIRTLYSRIELPGKDEGFREVARINFS